MTTDPEQTTDPDDDAAYLRRWAAAFPADRSPDVQAALLAVPDRPGPGSYTRHRLSTTRIDRCPGGLLLDGESITIPYRSYVEPVRHPDLVRDQLSEHQMLVLGCFYTRHHDGRVRHRWLRRILDSDETFVVPYVVQLVGEYVMEIITTLGQDLPELADPTSPTGHRHGRFLADNPAYHHLLRQRVASYWDCYFRGRYLRPEHCPSMILRDRLDRAVRRELAVRGG